MKYSPSFISAHKRLAPALPIGRFADIVNPQAIGFNSQKDFYAPVRFSVQVAEGVTGGMRLDVATEKNPNWLQDMKDQLAETLNLSSTGDSIELKTVTGKPLDQVHPTQLHNVGKLYVYKKDAEKPVFLSALPSVPAEYRVTKVADLKTWVNKLGDFIPNAVAAVLKGKDSHELEAALRNEGEVVKAIEKQLNGQNWAEFVRLHQSNSSKTPLKSEEAQKLLHKVSKQILAYVRNFVGAAREQVKTQIAVEQAQKIRASLQVSKEDEHFLKPVLSGTEASSSSSSPLTGNNKLFQTLVEDALSVPTLHKSLIGAIYNFDTTSAPTPLIASQRPAMKRVSSQHHPWYAHIHHTLLPIRGSFPSDYLARHTRQDMSAKAPYIGNVNKTYAAYHRFVGASVAPPPLRIKGGVPQPIVRPKKMNLVPIGCHGKCQGDECDKDIEARLIPIGLFLSDGEDEKVHIGCGQDRRSSSSSGLDIDAEIELVPVEGHYSHEGKGRHHRRRSSSSSGDDSYLGEEIPGLIPVGADVEAGMPKPIPRLVPVEGHYTHKGKGHHRRRSSSSSSGEDSYLGEEISAGMPKSVPRLVPVGSEMPIKKQMPGLIYLGSEEMEVSAMADDDFSNLPSVNDVFK